MIDCQVCVRVNGKTSAHLKSVFKMSTVCSKSNASSKTWTSLPDRFIDDQPPGGNVPTLRSGETSSGRRHTNLAAVTHDPAASIKSGSRCGLRSGLLSGHRAGVMKSGVS